jgi:hypothetical protein
MRKSRGEQAAACTDATFMSMTQEDPAVARKSARKKISSAADDARSSVRPAAESAIDRIGTATEQVISSVAASAEDARNRFGPTVEDARDKMVPVVAGAVATGRRRGREAAVRAGIVEEKKETHKFRNFLIVLGLGGVAAFVYTRMTGKNADPAWTTSRDSAASTPRQHAAPPTAAAVAAGPVDGSDTAPTAPLASEETVESPTPTTPDAPLEKKNV